MVSRVRQLLVQPSDRADRRRRRVSSAAAGVAERMEGHHTMRQEVGRLAMLGGAVGEGPAGRLNDAVWKVIASGRSRRGMEGKGGLVTHHCSSVLYPLDADRPLLLLFLRRGQRAPIDRTTRSALEAVSDDPPSTLVDVRRA